MVLLRTVVALAQKLCSKIRNLCDSSFCVDANKFNSDSGIQAHTMSTSISCRRARIPCTFRHQPSAPRTICWKCFNSARPRRNWRHDCQIVWEKWGFNVCQADQSQSNLPSVKTILALNFILLGSTNENRRSEQISQFIKTYARILHALWMTKVPLVISSVKDDDFRDRNVQPSAFPETFVNKLAEQLTRYPVALTQKDISAGTAPGIRYAVETGVYCNSNPSTRFSNFNIYFSHHLCSSNNIEGIGHCSVGRDDKFVGHIDRTKHTISIGLPTNCEN